MATDKKLKDKSLFKKATPRQRVVGLVFFCVMGAIFTVLILGAHGIIDMERIIDPCGFEQHYHLPCPGCGVTHSALEFVRGKVWSSFYTQPAGGILCTIGAISLFLSFLASFFGIYSKFLEVFFDRRNFKYIIIGVILIFLAGWAVTLSRAIIYRQSRNVSAEP